MSKQDQDLATLQARIVTALRTRQPRVLRWYRPGATGLERQIRGALDDPRSAGDRIPGRLACRLLRRHNWTCIARPTPHPRTW
ncbi:hypothetical protein [Streptomyces sp. CoT10]|uniref:hypothetical protein n=1 Tax=Streptomyces sp. CoT10 TaxID=2875762 RepID=UPI001CD7A417|nr:hypothetical protein [Streptomyces sp. CoT10]